MKKSIISIPISNSDIQLYALYSPFNIIKQAWALNQFMEFDFSMLQSHFELTFKKEEQTSFHNIYISNQFEHVCCWLLENKGTRAILSNPHPAPSSFLILKGDIDNHETDLILQHIKKHKVFQYINHIPQTNDKAYNWLSYIELYKEKEDKKGPIK